MRRESGKKRGWLRAEPRFLIYCRSVETDRGIAGEREGRRGGQRVGLARVRRFCRGFAAANGGFSWGPIGGAVFLF